MELWRLFPVSSLEAKKPNKSLCLSSIPRLKSSKPTDRVEDINTFVHFHRDNLIRRLRHPNLMVWRMSLHYHPLSLGTLPCDRP